MAPRRRTAHEKAQVAAFINRLYELSGHDTTVEFASRAGLYGSNVGEYMAGKTMPDGYTLLRLMSSVGVEFTVRGRAVDLPVPAGSNPGVPPEELSEAVAALSKSVEDLRAQIRQLESLPLPQQLPAEETQQPPEAGKSRARGGRR